MERFEGLLRFEAHLERLNAVENIDSIKQLVLEWKSLKNAFEKSLIELEVEKRSLRDVLDANKKQLTNLGVTGATVSSTKGSSGPFAATQRSNVSTTDLSFEPALVRSDRPRAEDSFTNDGFDSETSTQQPGLLVKCSANGPK